MYPALADFVIEFFATFLFVIINGMVYDTNGQITGIALGFGASLLVASERADLNPVVSIAIALCDSAMGWSQLFIRVLAQIVGAILGGLVSVGSWRREKLDFSERNTVTATKALVFEIVFACILILVVLRTRESGLGAFTHGFCYTVACFCGMLMFKGSTIINPATALGLMTGSNAFDRTTDESYVWLYLVGPFIGALLAVVFYQLTEYLNDEYEESEVEETTEFVRTTVVTPMEQVQPNPDVTKPETNGYVQPVNVHGRGQVVDTYQGANTYQGAYRTEGYKDSTNGNTMNTTEMASIGGQNTRYTTEMSNPGGQNRYIQPHHLN